MFFYMFDFEFLGWNFFGSFLRHEFSRTSYSPQFRTCASLPFGNGRLFCIDLYVVHTFTARLLDYGKFHLPKHGCQGGLSWVTSLSMSTSSLVDRITDHMRTVAFCRKHTSDIYVKSTVWLVSAVAGDEQPIATPLRSSIKYDPYSWCTRKELELLHIFI